VGSVGSFVFTNVTLCPTWIVSEDRKNNRDVDLARLRRAHRKLFDTSQARWNSADPACAWPADGGARV